MYSRVNRLISVKISAVRSATILAVKWDFSSNSRFKKPFGGTINISFPARVVPLNSST